MLPDKVTNAMNIHYTQNTSRETAMLSVLWFM